MKRNEIKLPGLLIGSLDGGSLERRVLRLLETPWARRWRVVSAVMCAGAMATAAIGAGMVGVRPSLAQSGNEAAKLAAFDAVTIKPASPKMYGFYGYPGGRVFYGGDTKMLVETAFNLQEYQVPGGPGWFSSRKFEVNAVPPESSASRNLKIRTAEPTAEQQQMLQSLLRDRFGLKYHFETKESEVYILSLGSGTLRLKPTEHSIVDPRAVIFGRLGGVDQLPKDNGAAAKDNGATGGAPHGGPGIPDGATVALQGYNATADLIAVRMSRYLQLPVVNQTGLEGVYDFDIPLADPENHDLVVTTVNLANDLGLKLKRGRGPVRTLVIDHIDLPTEN